MKYIELITDAFRARNVIDETQQPGAEQTQSALRKLSQMAAEWLANGIDIQYVPIAPAAVASTDLTIPEWAEAGVTAQLAIRLNASRPVGPELGLSASEGLATIQRLALKDKLVAVNMQHVPAGSGFPRTTDIRNL